MENNVKSDSLCSRCKYSTACPYFVEEDLKTDGTWRAI